LTWFIFYCITI